MGYVHVYLYIFVSITDKNISLKYEMTVDLL